MVKLDLEFAADTTSVQGQEIIDRFLPLLEKTGLILPLSIITLIILAYIYNDRLLFTKPYRSNMVKPPGAIPLIGHTYEIVKGGTEKQFERMQEMALLSPNNVIRITFLTQGSLILLHRPEYLEYIQKTNFENYPKGELFRFIFEDLLGREGIFVADGNVWKSQRKMASHMFSARQFNNWVQQVVHHELTAIDGLLDNVSSSSSTSFQGNDNNNTIKMPELFFRYTLSSFSKMAFSADLKCLSEDPTSLQREVPFAVAFDYAQGVMNSRFVMPGWKYIEYFTGTGQKMKEAIKVINEFGESIIKERIAESEREKSEAIQRGTSEITLQNKGKDLLGFFMEHTRDPKDLLTVVLNFILAGRDTTAQTLSWLFYELAAHPEHVEIIREEIENVMGKDSSQEKKWLPFEQMKQLPYTQAVMHETIRLHPPVPKNGKQALKDDVIIPQGPNPHNLPPVKVYAGERVGWSDWVMNRLEDVWGIDANEFKPNRFLTKGEKGEWIYVQQSQWKFHSFNAGPRLCLGMNLANYETLAFIAATLPKYDFKWATKEQGQTSDWPPTYANSVTHPMKDHYLCTVQKRQQ